MANHAVDYALNEAIELFEREGVWAGLGPERTRELILKLLDVGRHCGGSAGDALQDLGPRYRICCECHGEADEFRGLRCPACHAALVAFERARGRDWP